MLVASIEFDMSSDRYHVDSWSWWLFVIGVVLLGGAIVLGVDGYLAARSPRREFQASLAAVTSRFLVRAVEVPGSAIASDDLTSYALANDAWSRSAQ